MADRIQDLGVFTAYGEAREAGYEGSKAEFELGLKKSAEYAENAQASATAAAASADDAELSAAGAAESAEDAETSAGEATQSATDAAASAVAAADSANAASASAAQAASNAQAALGDIAPIFEDTKPYSVGDYVIYTDGKLYRFTDAHTAGAWVGTDVTAVVIGQDVSELKSAFTELEPRVDSLEINKADVITSSASGSIASFSDGADDMPAKELNIAIEPVQAGSGDPSPDNVRPISGWTSAKVTRTGKNLLPLTLYSGGAYNADVGGVFTFSLSPKQFTKSGDSIYTIATTSSWESYTMLAPLKNVSQRVQFSGKLSSTDQVGYTAYLLDKDYTVLDKWNGNTNPYNFDIYFSLSNYPDARFISLTITNRGTASEILTLTNPQLEETSLTATAYEPYQGETYDITFPSEAGTVYGGTLDATSGVLTVDRAMVDMGTLSWAYEVENMRFFSDSINTSVKKSTTNIISSMYVVGSTLTTNGTMAITGDGNLYVRNTAYNSVADFKPAMSGVQLCYELATPITYTLTVSEIRTLLGANNIWADTGDVSVAYKADTKLYIDKKFAELQALILEN